MIVINLNSESQYSSQWNKSEVLKINKSTKDGYLFSLN